MLAWIGNLFLMFGSMLDKNPNITLFLKIEITWLWKNCSSILANLQLNQILFQLLFQILFNFDIYLTFLKSNISASFEIYHLAKSGLACLTWYVLLFSLFFSIVLFVADLFLLISSCFFVGFLPILMYLQFSLQIFCYCWQLNPWW